MSEVLIIKDSLPMKKLKPMQPMKKEENNENIC